MNKNNLHIERLLKIRPFVDFNFNINKIKSGNLSEYEKKKIKKYYDEISELTAHPHYIYKPRNKDRRAAALEFANQSNLKGIKNVILPVDFDGAKPKLKFNKDGLKVDYGYTEQRAIRFNKNKLLNNPDDEINRVKNKLADANNFTVMCGKHESIKEIRTRETINKLVKDWQTQYKNSALWLNGLYGYKTKNQSSFNEYINAKKASREKFQAISKRDRQRNKMIDKINFSLETTTDRQLRNQLKNRKNNLIKLLGK